MLEIKELNVPGGDTNAYRSTVVILFVILIANGMATMLADRWLGRKV